MVTLIFSCLISCTGNWHKGNRHGEGILTSADGKVLHNGLWRKNWSSDAAVPNKSPSTTAASKSSSKPISKTIHNKSKGTTNITIINSSVKSTTTKRTTTNSKSTSSHSFTGKKSAADGYVGEVRDGMRHGRGRMEFEDGNIYEGIRSVWCGLFYYCVLVGCLGCWLCFAVH